MCKYFKCVFLSTLLFLLTFSSTAFSKTCILSLFEESTKEAKIVNSVFAFYHEADYFKKAQIKDIKECFTSGKYEEIIWISHGSSIRSGISSYSAPILVQNNGTKIILPLRFFETLIKETDYRFLKKVRVNLCGLDFSKKDVQLHSSIDPFIKKLEAEKIEVDISKKFRFGSFLLKENITLIDRKWLSKSISLEFRNNFELWETESSRDCMSDQSPECDRSEARVVIPLSSKRQ